MKRCAPLSRFAAYAPYATCPRSIPPPPRWPRGPTTIGHPALRRAPRYPPRGERTATEPVELLRPQDVFFLHVETPHVRQHVCGLALIDPVMRDGRKLGLEDLVRAVADRLDRLPRFRQRLAGPPLS